MLPKNYEKDLRKVIFDKVDETGVDVFIGEQVAKLIKKAIVDAVTGIFLELAKEQDEQAEK